MQITQASLNMVVILNNKALREQQNPSAPRSVNE